MKPQRIQLRRAKGWKMPPNTMKVDRTTKWGNPFKVGPGRTRDYAVELFGRMLQGWICICDNPTSDEQEAYRAMVKKDHAELRGKNLACWCRIGDPCHADVLLHVNHEAIDAVPVPS